MHASRSALARFAWFVSFTILLAALLPTLSHAMVAGGPGDWGQICSASGARFVSSQAPDDQAGKNKSPSTSRSADCPYCVFHHGAPALPPNVVAWITPSSLRFEQPARFLSAAAPLFAWAAALARAPPTAA